MNEENVDNIIKKYELKAKENLEMIEQKDINEDKNKLLEDENDLNQMKQMKQMEDNLEDKQNEILAEINDIKPKIKIDFNRI